MLIGALNRFSLVDYPNKTCAIIFTIGCSFRCPYCHNRELVLENEFPKPVSFEEIEEFLKKRVGLLDAVEFTGGEPLLHKDLVSYIKKIKDMGFLVKVDTNGSMPERLKEIIPYTDYIAMDIKAPLETYTEATQVGVDINKIKESINLIMNEAYDYEFRTTIFKNFFKTVESFISVGNLIRGAKAYYLQKPHFDKVLDPNYNFETFKEEEISAIVKLLKEFVKIVEVR
ncbi:MAG: anaerobic ribonucleoside-triphosphate reductase activating protein [Caldisericaceae bacterium]